MYVAVTVVHIVACLFLIGVVLLQQGKGADMGAVFGGSSQTVFGSSGAGNFLTRLTTGMAVVFMITSLTLAYGSAQRVGSTVFDDAPLPEAQAPPAQPDAAPAPQADAASGDTSAVVVEQESEGASTVVEVQQNAPAAGEAAEEAAAGAPPEADTAVEGIAAEAEGAVEEVEEAAQAVEQKGEEAAEAVVGGEVEEAPGEVDPVPPAVP